MRAYLDNIELLAGSECGSYVSKGSSVPTIGFSKDPLKCIDFVLVYRDDLDERSKKRELISEEQEQYLTALENYGLDIEKDCFERDSCKIFVWKLHGHFDTLLDLAEDLKMKMATKESDIPTESFWERNFPGLLEWIRSKDPFIIRPAACETTRSYFMATFNKEQMENFQNHDREDLFFSHSQRNRLVHYICTKMELNDLIHRGIFTDAYTLHQGSLKKQKSDPPENTRQRLQHDWASWSRMFKYQPIQSIKDYFGEKIGLYFCWLGLYTAFLIPAGFVGLLCFLWGVSTAFSFIPADEACDPKNDKLFHHCPQCDKYCSYYPLRITCLYIRVSHFFDNEATMFFATFMSLWATLFLEFWKRKQASLAYEWQTSNYEDEEEMLRPEYVRNASTLRPNVVTQKMDPFMPLHERVPRIVGAIGVVMFFLALVVASLLGVIVYRAVIYSVLLAQKNNLIQSQAKIVVSGSAATINLIVINILRIIYSKIAKVLTNWENPRTLTDYEDSFTFKMFWFQFVNTYSSVFYVAFFKSATFMGRPGRFTRFGKQSFRLEGCSDAGCFLELCVQLIIIMVGQQIVGNIGEVCLPLIKVWYNKRFVKEPYMHLPQWVKDYDLEPREELSLFWEYLELVLQYGFVTMFVAAFPLAPFFALLNNIVEIRVDAINFVCNYRRPVCHRAKDIGAWYPILTTLTEISVVVNALVIAFTSELIPRIVYTNVYSADGSLHGYVNHSLSYFNVSNFNELSRPENPTANVPYILPYCRYPGYHEPHPPYRHNNKYYLILSVRLAFVFLFQWLVTAVTRILAWWIPDVPKSLMLKIKRENFLANEAVKDYKEKKGMRRRRVFGTHTPVTPTRFTRYGSFFEDPEML